MIKILHLQTELNLSCGVTRTISQITKNTSRDFEHHLIALDGDGLSRFTDFGFHPTLLKYKRNSVIGAIKIFKSLAKYCKNNSIQIIHSHHRYFDALSKLLKLFLSVKTITSVQSKVYGNKIISYKADMLIPCSNFIKEHLIKNFKIKEERLKVIYNSVDQSEIFTGRSKEEIMSELNIQPDNFVIGYFGRLDYLEKGIDILLEAFRLLSETNKNIFLLLIGNGKDENEIKSFISVHQLNAKVFNSKKDIYNYYQLIDVYVLPSRIEPFGIVILEAAIMKKPVVASNVDGIPELIDHEINGLLFEPENIDDLITKIIKILDNPKLKNEYVQNLYRKVMDTFTTEKTIPLFERVYRDVIK
ncbi:MAG: glycosyltransferase family 4 protein [Ignavibacterium sp.]|jgi:glycosyltransferase involved in cell wall biosynthesis|nr:glycosyltransferase family 4 protein [Ignavibacterium sp.]